jgi:hypothetical protein
MSDDLIRIAGIINPTKTNVAIAQALGLNPTDINSITLEFAGGKTPVAHIKMYVTSEMTDKLAVALKRCHLIERITEDAA